MTRYVRAELFEQLLRKSPGRDPCGGLPRRSPLQHISRIMKIELLRAGKVRMTRSWCYELSRFRLRSRCRLNGEDFLPVRPIAIFNPQRDRRANRASMPHPGKNVCLVLLDLLPSASAITQLPSVQLA